MRPQNCKTGPIKKCTRELSFALAVMYGRYFPISTGKWQTCMNLLAWGGCHPWKHPTVWQQLIDGRSRGLIHIKQGYQIAYDLNDSSFIPIYFFREYEPLIQKFFKHNISSGSIVFDVGANIGLHTLFLAKLVGPQGAVHAFEPVKETIRRAQQNLALNSQQAWYPIVRFNAFGLGADERNTTIYKVTAISGKGIDSGYSSLIKTQLPQTRSLIEEQIEVKSLDHYVESEKIARIDFVKCDIEGGEWNFWLGAQNSIKRFHPVLLFEWNPGQNTYDGKRFADLLQHVGYTPKPLCSLWSRWFRGREFDPATFHGNVAFLQEI